MRYCDYLRATVLMAAVSATALAVVALGAAQRDGRPVLVVFALGWWTVAAVLGLWLGRKDGVMASIREVLSRSRPEPVFPKIEPASILLNRHWPIVLIALTSAAVSIFLPSAASAAAGYGFMWALAWRRQSAAIEAIERRDGVRFWVVKTSAFAKIKVVRVLGYGDIGQV